MPVFSRCLPWSTDFASSDGECHFPLSGVYQALVFDYCNWLNKAVSNTRKEGTTPLNQKPCTVSFMNEFYVHS